MLVHVLLSVIIAASTGAVGLCLSLSGKDLVVAIPLEHSILSSFVRFHEGTAP